MALLVDRRRRSRGRPPEVVEDPSHYGFDKALLAFRGAWAVEILSRRRSQGGFFVNEVIVH